MDWLSGMNAAMGYIEDHLTDEIHVQEMAKMLCCSSVEFGRVFAFITGVTLSDYIRRRKLTQAGIELRHGTQKVIDIAMKYGYTSHAAFSRAFREMHGVTPQLARDGGVMLMVQTRLSFTLSIGGLGQMQHRMVTLPSFKVVGMKAKNEVESGGNNPWLVFMNDYNQRLYNQGGQDNYYHAPLYQIGLYLQDEDTCIIGAQLAAGRSVPDGMDVMDVPAHTWAVFTVNEVPSTSNDIIGKYYTQINTQWLPASGYQKVAHIASMESFPPGDPQSSDYCYEIWIPVIKR